MIWSLVSLRTLILALQEKYQSRLRGLTMAISNKHGTMVLATGNKSEYTAGYSTLYGDMCGGFAPLRHLEGRSFSLCKWRNKRLPIGAAGNRILYLIILL